MYLACLIVLVSLAAARAEEDFTDSQNSIKQYLREISESGLDVTAVFTSASYYDDGSVKVLDTFGFSKKQKNDDDGDFDLSTLTKKQIQKLVSNAEDDDVTVSLYHFDKENNETTNYETEEQDIVEGAAANIVSNVKGFDAGLIEELTDTIYETNKDATIDLIQYDEKDIVKQNTTIVIQARKVTVVSSKQVKTKMLEEATKLLKKAFKIDIDDRAEVIAELFNKKFDKFKWHVLINPVEYKIKHDKMITLSFENNTYVLLGIEIAIEE